VTRMFSFVIVMALAACSSSTPAVAGGEASAPDEVPVDAVQSPAETAVKPVPAQLPDVVAHVNGEPISRADLETALAQLEGRAGQPVPPDQRDRVVRGLLDQLIAYRLLVQESAARRIGVPDTEVEARIAQIRSQFPSDQVFQQALAEQNLTLVQLRSDLREGLQIDRLVEAEVEPKAAVTSQQVDEFYASNPSEFHQTERVRASHILVRAPEEADAATRESARVKAGEILKEVRAGKDFAELAKQHSDDPGSAPDGGDLGYFERGQMVGPFDETAFSLAPAATSDLVETPFGFHIIRVLDKQAARTIPLSEVRPQVEEFLRERNREQHTEAFIDSLKTKGKVEIHI
jgi:peptidyl-prolyl cis-trans isomerase C